MKTVGKCCCAVVAVVAVINKLTLFLVLLWLYSLLQLELSNAKAPLTFLMACEIYDVLRNISKYMSQSATEERWKKD